MKVAVIGLGLIGGSIARDLTAAGHTVVGHDRSKASLRSARRAGAVVEAIGADFAGLESCDACVLAVPVLDAPRLLARAIKQLPASALITDVGSTKVSIVQAAVRLGAADRFVGAHPFAGDHRSGWKASRRGLFAGVSVFLTPTRATRPAMLAKSRKLWRAVGGKPKVVSATEHDALMAGASHLPQLVSSTLGASLLRAGVSRATLGRGGRDVTRLAGSDPRVWSAILLDNADRIAPLARANARLLAKFAQALDRGDGAAVRRLLTDSNRWFRAGPPAQA
ncbi:MAG: prephenate dehydrogenase/arogenate dehydrogenase family protein [Gemmatimonadetes bacterium]|nr:prephenate dehydrogenase/arogenate dehydrogenase family protein [Gemmatimonadota bacterium]